MDPRYVEPSLTSNVSVGQELFLNIQERLSDQQHQASKISESNGQWFICSFKHQKERGRRDFPSTQYQSILEVVASGDNLDSLVDSKAVPPCLFAPNALCYGVCHINNRGSESSSLSFCWKGQSLPVSLKTKFAEYNNKIVDFLGASVHFVLSHPDQLRRESLVGLLSSQRSPGESPRRSSANLFRAQSSHPITISQKVCDALNNIQSNQTPFNWMICGFESGSDDTEKFEQLELVDIGMNNLYALKGMGGIGASLQSGKTLYIYIRVDINIPHSHNNETVSKYVLVTWQGHQHDSLDIPSSGEITAHAAKLLDTASIYSHAAQIYRFFPHHIHMFASNQSELSEEIVLERVRQAIDSDYMIFRVVCVQSGGEYQPAVCLEVPRDATVDVLQECIASKIGIAADCQYIASNQTSRKDKNAFLVSKATRLNEDKSKRLVEDLGLAHGEKIYVECLVNGTAPSLSRMVEQVNSGKGANYSLSAERRHEVNQIIATREAELMSSILKAQNQIGEKMKERKIKCQNQDKSNETSEESAETSSSLNIKSMTLKKRYEDIEPEMACLEKRVKELEEENEYFEIPFDSIRILDGKENELGMGKAATVYRGLWLGGCGTAEVAIKVFRYHNLTEKIRTEYRFEVGMLRKLRHPNIVMFIGACTKPNLMILTEFCSHGSLYGTVQNKEVFRQISWGMKVRMMLDAARGIQYLHSMRIIHRDIKSHNLLLDDDWRLKVADFGISKVLDAGPQAFTQCGTTGWVAPEVLVDEETGYTMKADNWSFSIVLWEMIAGENVNPFIGMAPLKFFRQTIEMNVRPHIDDDVDPEYTQLIRECWASEPTQRPSFADIVLRLEKILVELGMSIDLPPEFQGGYQSNIEQ